MRFKEKFFIHWIEKENYWNDECSHFIYKLQIFNYFPTKKKKENDDKNDRKWNDK